MKYDDDLFGFTTPSSHKRLEIFCFDIFFYSAFCEDSSSESKVNSILAASELNAEPEDVN